MALKKVLLGPLMRRLYRHEVTGLENVPQHSAAILASNHLTFLDSIFVPLAVPRQMFYLAKADYFTTGGLKGKAMKAFFSGVGQIPINRSGGTRSSAAVEQGVQVLREGKLLGIYPEGTRSPDGRIYRAKTGVARIALAARVPVIPVGQMGNDDVQPLGSNKIQWRKNGKKITVKTVIGAPIDLSPYYDTADSYETLREVSDLILHEIQKITDQEYVPVYASDVKALMKERNITAEEAVETLQQH
ncbi:lysophospholipid acyltransferase family protein [Rothia sp. ZJ1223]|uniref:lysophospholipid acyltransferase family protein n=1 Tax=unclassified Rothia (in: high G+C Gram-positive bacteria) TaxID=2689056 RepID=UPI00351C2063